MLDCLHNKFPQFADLLDRGRGDPIEQIRSPASDDELRNLEMRLGVPLPTSYKEFLRCARAFTLRGGSIQFTPGHPFFHEFPDFNQLTPAQRQLITSRGGVWPPPSQGMLCIAEFFLEGDGDQVLFDVKQDLVAGEYPIFYYDHDTPSVRRLATSFPQFLERCLTYFDEE